MSTSDPSALVAEARRVGKDLAEKMKEIPEYCCHGEAGTLLVQLADACETMQEDVKLAAGELLIELPYPGTDVARLMRVNSQMRRERDEARREVEKWKRRAERQGDRIEDGWEECQRLRKVVQMAAQEEQHAYWCPYTMRHDKARQYEPCDCTCHVRAAREALRQALGTDTAEKP